MSNWGYAIAQGVAGAAQSGVASIDAKLKEETEMRAETRAADRKLADAERLVAIQEAATMRAEERKRARAAAMGGEIDAKATGLLNESDASNINAKFGSAIDTSNPESKATLDAIRKNPEAAKAYGLLEDDEIGRSGRRGEAARALGYTDAAKEETGNLRALQADKTNREKGERDDKRLDNMQEFQQRSAKRQEDLAAAQIAHMKVVESNANTRAQAASDASQRQATTAAMKGVEADIKALEKEAAGLDVDPARKAVIERQLAAARAEAGGYRRALGGAGLPAVDAPEVPKSAPPPGAIDFLKKNPAQAAAFEAKYGVKAADYLTSPAPTAPGAPPAAKPQAPKAGILGEEQGPPSPAEQAGQKLDAVRKEFSALGNPPPGRMAAELAAWREKRDEILTRLNAAKQEYEAAIGPNAQAYFGK